MAARVIRASASLALLVVALVGCTGTTVAPPAAQPTAGTTPMASLSPVVAGTAGALGQYLAEAGGYRLDAVRRSYRPAEPPELADTPRAVFQADVGDPDAGFVVVYEFSSPDIARERGALFARYLASGFGQTNYPLDAQFALSQVGPTLVFHWWSRERAEDPERARGAFDVISRFGLPIEVRR